MGAPGPATGGVSARRSPWACTSGGITDTQVSESELISAYRHYLEKVDRQAIVLKKDEEYYIVPTRSKCRYFVEGQNRIRRKIRRTVPMKAVHGVAICLTEDPKTKSRREAWRTHGRAVSRLIKNLRERFRRRGVRFPPYVKVAEEQTKNTGYPHTHMFIPGIKWLVHYKTLERLWGRGSTSVEYKTSSAGRYVWKYVGKMKGWTERGRAFLWAFRVRLYHVGQELRGELPPSEPGWEFVSLERAHGMENPDQFLERLRRVYLPRDPPKGGDQCAADRGVGVVR